MTSGKQQRGTRLGLAVAAVALSGMALFAASQRERAASSVSAAGDRHVEHSHPLAVAPADVQGPPGKQAELRDNERPAPAAASTTGAETPGARTPSAVHHAVGLEPAGPFATPAAEGAFWRARLEGERLTLDGRSKSFGAVQRVLDRGGLGQAEQSELEQRRAALEAKLGEQTERVALIEQRISELGEP